MGRAEDEPAERDDGPQMGHEAYRLVPTRPPPPGYPGRAAPDPVAERCFAPTFAARRAAFLDAVRARPASSHLAGAFHEIARLAAGAPVHAGIVEAAVAHVEARRDCADFLLHALLRLLLQLPDHEALEPALWERMRRCVHGFKYHPEEPGRDSLCTWTENHQILFAAGAFLAGGLFPDARFASDGRTGREKRAAARVRILRWLDLRFRTGFSEWLSHVYYDEDLVALLSLVDFAGDAEIAERAAMVVDLLLLDLALHGFRGAFASTHGRSYAPGKQRARLEPTSDTQKLVFGTGSFAREENMSAVCLALSPRYRLPAALFAVSRDLRDEVEVRQRMGLRVEDGPRFGMGFRDAEDGMAWLAMEAYAHPRIFPLFVDLLERFGWWHNEFFAAFARRRRLLRTLRRSGMLPGVARLFAWDLTRNLREEVHVVTWRTPDAQLSSALDWRPGAGGDQQHLWQATLGPDAVCFTTHPGPPGSRSPGWWTGSGCLPRVAQCGNVVLALYRIHRRPALYLPNVRDFTHAWLPRDRFDEVREEGPWIFARRGEGYLALRASRPVHWREAQARELVAPGRRCVWVCEVGRAATDGSFTDFATRIAAAPFSVRGLRVRYRSPRQGWLELGWRGPLRRDGTPVPLRDPRRLASPWGEAPFPTETLRIEAGGHTLRLDWTHTQRSASGFV